MCSGSGSGSRLCHICDCASLDRAFPLSSLSSLDFAVKLSEFPGEHATSKSRSNLTCSKIDPTFPPRHVAPRGRELFCLIFHGLPRSTLSWGPFKFRRCTRITFALEPLVHLRSQQKKKTGNLLASKSNHDYDITDYKKKKI